MEQSDEKADTLKVDSAGNALVGAVDASVALVIVDHKGGETNALRANALIVGSVGRADHGRGDNRQRLE